MENSDYVIIHQWMLEMFKPKEKKKGATLDYIKLMIYAYIYSFSRDGESKWYGKQQTLAEITGCSEDCCKNKLKELVNDGLIYKETIDCYGCFHHNNYYVNIQKLPVGVQKLPQGVQNASQGVSEITNNNTINNIHNNTYVY